MTGFGKKILQLAGKKISIEIKSLNSKTADINLRLPSFYRVKEGEIRQQIASRLIRGKIDCNINVEVTGVESAPRINTELAEAYLHQLKSLADRTSAEGDMLGAIMRIPDIWQSAQDELGEEEWLALKAALNEALDALMAFKTPLLLEENAPAFSEWQDAGFAYNLAHLSRLWSQIEALRSESFYQEEKWQIESQADQYLSFVEA